LRAANKRNLNNCADVFPDLYTDADMTSCYRGMDMESVGSECPGDPRALSGKLARSWSYPIIIKRSSFFLKSLFLFQRCWC